MGHDLGIPVQMCHISKRCLPDPREAKLLGPGYILPLFFEHSWGPLVRFNDPSNTHLGGGFKYCVFSPLLKEMIKMIQFDYF